MTSKRDLLAGLRAIGYWEVPSTSRKYLMFARTTADGARRLLVGRSGALRLLPSDERRVDHSISLTGGKVHRAICEVGRRAPYPNVEVAMADYLALQSR